MKRRFRTLTTGFVAAVVVPAMVLGASPGWSTDQIPPPTLPDVVTDAGTPPVARGVLQGLEGASGTVEVSVRLAEPAIAETVAEGAIAAGTVPGKGQQRAQKSKVKAQQDSFVSQARGLGVKELARTQLAANLVAVTVDAAQLQELAALENVVSVTPIRTYETHGSTQADRVESGSLAQAIDYVQATAVHQDGFDGTGVNVAVLDSGIDFTHFNLGGPGDKTVTDACMAGADEAVTGDCADFFGPDAPKVKGGFDFVGGAWPNGVRVSDPNPIDAGTVAGHGTHVADIVGGRSADGTHQGIAPGVNLYAVKVCSSVATSCNGVSMLLGMDWALDPNGDGDISDAVDVVNMSLGSDYGQEQDDSAFAADNLVHAGIVVVASAGNAADRPFIVGSPSSATGAISVAQTALPDDLQWVIESVAMTITNSVHQAWSPVPEVAITGALARPSDTSGLGCSQDAFAGFPAGEIALIQRGECNASDKALSAQKAGASAVLIFNNVAGDPPSFSFGSAEPVTIPTFTLSQADGLALVAALPLSVKIDPANAISLANTMVGTSSRGPTMGDHRAKPDIGAPGAWLSAETGTATEVTNFGGTSGAAPVVSGAAALLIDKFPDEPPAVIKARLLNAADNTNRTPTADGFITTPISRIGAGEVRVAPAADATTVVSAPGGNLGLGIPSVTRSFKTTVDVTLTNTSRTNKTYAFDTVYRDSADEANGAVTMRVTPASTTVPKGKSRTIKVRVEIDGSKLPDWPFDSVGAIGGTGAALNGPEYDGWFTATSGSEVQSLGWTVLPKRAADVSAPSSIRLKKGSGVFPLKNASAVASGDVELFALTGTSPSLPTPGPGDPGSPGSNVALIDLAATGVRDAGQDAQGRDLMQFGIATYDRRTVLPYPAEFDVYVDSDNDGIDDFVLYNAEFGGFAATGQTVAYVANLRTGGASAYYYVDGGFASSTQILTAPASALGITPGQPFSFSVYAFDNYFSGSLTDFIVDQVHTLDAPKFTPTGTVTVGAKSSTNVEIQATGSTSPSTQTGVLSIYRSAATDDFDVVLIAE